MPKKEFFSFQTSEGTELNGWMIKPANFSASKKYPVLMYQYSGPGSQQVLDKFGVSWETYMASQGYVVVCVDGRGTGGRGAEFAKSTYLNLGVKEAKDQVETALYLGRQPYVDKNRIGIWGWSYGGYMTIMSMSEGTPVFKAGAAVAPVTDWNYYDTVYGERFMRTPKEKCRSVTKPRPPLPVPTTCMAICCWYMAWRMITFISRIARNMPNTSYNLANSSTCRSIPTATIASSEATPVCICIPN